MAVTIRNTITNERMEIPAEQGKNVKDAVQNSGFVAGDFSVRDKQGNVIDDSRISEFDGQVVNVGLPGRTVVGGKYVAHG